MVAFFEFIKTNMFATVLVATALQIIGTAILALFSFKGIVISVSNNVRVNNKPVTHVEINSKWLRASQIALVLLLAGIAISGIGSLASIS